MGHIVTDHRLVIGDADVLVALVNEEDAHHSRAHTLSLKLHKEKAEVLFPVSAFSEAVTVCRRRLNKWAAAAELITLYSAGELHLLTVDESIVQLAVPYWQTTSSKHNTFFDAIICAVCEAHQASAIFSFDQWYQKQGFVLVS